VRSVAREYNVVVKVTVLLYAALSRGRAGAWLDHSVAQR